MIILPNELTTQEIRVLQEFRRLNLDSMTPDQIKAIKHPAGGGEAPAAGLVAKRYLAADPSGYTITESGKAFISVDAKPMFEEAGAASSSGEAEVDADTA